MLLYASANLQTGFRSAMLWSVLELERDNSLHFFFFFYILLIVWLLALNLCQNRVGCQICVTASEMIFCHPVTGTIKERTKERALTLLWLTFLLVSAIIIVRRALTLTLNCPINLMSAVGLCESVCLCNKKADSLNLTASSRRFSIFELRWSKYSEAFKEHFRVVFVSHREHAVTGILQSELFSQSQSSWKQREEKRDSRYIKLPRRQLSTSW